MRGSKPRSAAPRVAGVITSLAAKRGRSDRVTVRIDGAKAFDLAAVVAEEEALHVGDFLSEEAQASLLARDAPFRARERALALLALRDRSRGEIELRLKMAGFSPVVVSGAVEWLVGLGYLDDGRFAVHYAAEKLKSGWGPQRIRAELLRKGVEREMVDEGLSRASGSADATEGLEVATVLARRRFGEQFRCDPVTATRRLGGFLARRGYDWETVAAVTRILVTEAGEGPACLEPESDIDTGRAP